MIYKPKPFHEILIGDLFWKNKSVWRREDGINFLTNAVSTDGIKFLFDMDDEVIDITNQIEEERPRTKMDHLNAGALEHNAMCEFTTFGDIPVNRQFSSLSTSYIKTSLTRLKDGSNAVRLDDSTVFIADNRKVEIYR